MIKIGMVISGVAVTIMALGAVPVGANTFQQTWSEFENRCLIPFEDFKPAIVDDLSPIAGRADAYQLENGSVLVVGGSEDFGRRSCSVEGSGLVRGFKAWVATALETGRYRQTDEPGVWMSHEWIEPRILVQKTPKSIRVVETELES